MIHDLGTEFVSHHDIPGRIHHERLLARLDDPTKHWKFSEGDLDERLKSEGIVGISDVDTRALTLHLRDKGAMRMGIFSGPAAELDPTVMLETVLETPRMAGARLAEEVSVSAPEFVPAVGQAKFSVAAVDLGIKAMTPQRLAERGIDVHVLPASVTFAEIEALGVDGVFFSNGPGDPATADDQVALLRQVLTARIPFFGICYGLQCATSEIARPPLCKSCRAEKTVSPTSSTMLFHSPQSSHWPCHRLVTVPHC